MVDRRGLGHLYFVELASDRLQIAPNELLHGWHVTARLSQHVGRMKRHDQVRPTRPGVPDAALTRDAETGAEKRFRRRRPEREDDFRSDDRDLAVEILAAIRELFLHRRAIGDASAFVRRGAALDRVRDEDVFAAKIDRGEHLRQKLSGAPDEGFALTIFVLAGSFADDHQVRIRIADPADDFRPRAADDAAPAGVGLRVKRAQRRAFRIHNTTPATIATYRRYLPASAALSE